MRIGPGSVVVVTGASAGVGRAVARTFAARGCHVGLIARGRRGLEAARAEIEHAGGRALALSVDVADADAVFLAAERFEAELGPIDVWVNNAMATVFGPVSSASPAEIRRVTEVTYLGYVHGTMAALAHMRRRDRGTIVQVGSALAYRGIPLQAAYCGAKHAVRGFTDSLRCELIHDGAAVRLSMVQLPAIDTPQFDWARNHLPKRPHPVPPIYRPEVAAAAIVDAAERAPREVWLGASTLQVVAGATVAPALLDRLLARRAWDGQMDREPALPRPDNLDMAVEGDRGASGRFGDQARRRALRVDQTVFLTAALAAAVGLGTALFGLGAAGRRPPRLGR